MFVDFHCVRPLIIPPCNDDSHAYDSCSLILPFFFRSLEAFFLDLRSKIHYSASDITKRSPGETRFKPNIASTEVWFSHGKMHSCKPQCAANFFRSRIVGRRRRKAKESKERPGQVRSR